MIPTKAMHPTLSLVAVLAALTLLTAMSADGKTQAPLADGCYALKAPFVSDWHPINGYLTHNGEALKVYHANRSAIGPWEKFYFKNTGPNNYLIYGGDKLFMSAQPLSVVTQVMTPKGWEEWEIHDLGKGQYGLRSVGHNQWLSAERAVVSVGLVNMKPNLDAWEKWHIEPTSGCTEIPGVDLNTNVEVRPSTGGPLWGIADLHGHAFTHEGFGGVGFQGQPFHPNGVHAAMPWCDQAHGPDHDGPAHGPGGTLDIIGNAIDETVGHDVGGYPQFNSWPRWNSSNHQQMYYEWIERAFRGGLRLQTMLAVNNEVLCEVYMKLGIGIPKYGCHDMPSVDRQIEGAKKLEAFIDDKHGGPGKGWFRIAYSAQQARDIIANGKMAVILGIEVDALFGCKKNHCKEDYNYDFVRKELDRYYAMGVRHVFPVHVFDNAFGGAALYNPLFNVGNVLVNGEFFEVEDCAKTGYDGIEYDANVIPADLRNTVNHLNNLLGLGLPHYDPARGHCNKKSLTPLGAFLIKEMIKRKMIIDVDHMSAKTVDAVLKIAEAENYPVVRGHTGFLGQSLGASRSESSPAFVERIRKLGGLVAPILHQGKAADKKQVGPVLNDCDESSKSWAQAYKYAVDKMKGTAVPFGSDMNGWIHQPSPRFGPDACAGNAGQARRQGNRVPYPFNAHGVPGTFGQLKTGDRVFDYNTDGFANIGLLPDFIQDLKQVGLSDADLKPLFSSAEAYVAMWERIEGTRPSGNGYTRVALGSGVTSMNWNQAKQYCEAQNLKLATRTDICGTGSEPRYGRPEGDIWMAVGDHENAWISIGTAYPERRCKFHEDLGAPPAWGTDRGPEPATGQPAALVCAPK